MPEETKKRSIWIGIAERVVSFMVVFAIAFMWVGSTRQKVQQKVLTLETEMAAWKTEWKEASKHITKMDLEGSVATKNFIANYDKKQSGQDEELKKLREEVNHLELMKAQIDRLERKIDDGEPRRRP
jgi:flagellar basal body-associated protein FliL